jgi:hypothetical protein
MRTPLCKYWKDELDPLEAFNEQGNPYEAAKKQASPKDYEGHWKADGAAHSQAPKWAKHHSKMVSEFPSPYRGTKDPLAREISGNA